MTKSLFEYFDPDKDSYEYTIKIAEEIDIDDDEIADCLETALDRYSIVAMEHIDTTPIQRNVTAFPNLKNIRVAIYRVAVEYPMSIRQLQNAVTDQLGITNNQVIVTKDYDPTEDNADSLLYNEEDEGDGEALLADPTYAEFEESDEKLHGNDYVEQNNNDIAEGSKERRENIRVWQSDLIPSERKVDVEEDEGVQYNHNVSNLSPLSNAFLNSEKEYKNVDGQLSPLLRESIERLKIPRSEKALLLKAFQEQINKGK